MSSRLSWATDWGSVSTEPKKTRREEGSKERNIEAGGVNSEASLGSKARPCLKSSNKTHQNILFLNSPQITRLLYSETWYSVPCLQGQKVRGVRFLGLSVMAV